MWWWAEHEGVYNRTISLNLTIRNRFMVMRFLAVWLIVGILVSGCGFHLRGKIPLSETLLLVAVESSDSGLRQEMVEALEGAGAEVIGDVAAARSVLKLHDIKYERKVRTLDTRGKVNGYRLIYSLKYTVTGQDGAELRKSRPLRLERDFNFDSNQLLQTENEERVLREDMIRDMAQRIIRQLSTIASRSAPVRSAEITPGMSGLTPS
jgi:LPS-assembly lipoprotein